MDRHKKPDARKEEIKKYFADRGFREMIIFGRQHQAVKRISDHVVSVSDAYLENHFGSAVETDKVIRKIAVVIEFYLAGYPYADAILKAKLRTKTPLRDETKRKVGLRANSK